MVTKEITQATLTFNLTGRLIKTEEFQINTEKNKIYFYHKGKFW